MASSLGPEMFSNINPFQKSSQKTSPGTINVYFKKHASKKLNGLQRQKNSVLVEQSKASVGFPLLYVRD